MSDAILIGVGIFVILMIIIGFRRGMIKMAFSLVSIVIVLILVNLLTPSVKQLLKETPIYDSIDQGIETYVDNHIESATQSITQTGSGAQEKIIDGLPLPGSVRDKLSENNTQSGYKQLEVSSFSSYIARSLSDIVIGAAAYIILFIVISILLRLLLHVLNIFTRLPVIHTFNAAGGAIIGLLEAVVILWVICVVITLFSTTSLGQSLCEAISDNAILSFIYDINPLQSVITSVLP